MENVTEFAASLNPLARAVLSRILHDGRCDQATGNACFEMKRCDSIRAGRDNKFLSAQNCDPLHSPIQDGRAYGSTRHSAKCLIKSDDRDIDVSLALGDCVLCLKLRALGIQQ